MLRLERGACQACCGLITVRLFLDLICPDMLDRVPLRIVRRMSLHVVVPLSFVPLYRTPRLGRVTV